jgi:hypothetical protein
MAASLDTLHQRCCPLYNVQSSDKHRAHWKKQGIKGNVSVRKATFRVKIDNHSIATVSQFNTLTPELNLSAQRCLTRFFTGNFAS